MVNDFEKVAELRNTLHYDERKFYDYFVAIKRLIDLNIIFTINNIINQYIDDYLGVIRICSTSLVDLIIKLYE